jgi:hypothetical protein
MRAVVFGVFAAVVVAIVPAGALTGGDYDLTRNTVDGGGSSLDTTGAYTFSGTVGQPDAGVMSSGAYVLRGGFWPEVGIPFGCIGDCTAGDRVDTADLVDGVYIALGILDFNTCPAFDGNYDRRITVDELVAGVNNALHGCPPAQ